MDLSRYTKYAKNLTAYFGASIIPMALSLATNPLVALNMSPEDYALSGYYLSFTTLISPIIIFYLVHFYIKEYFRLDEEKRQRMFAVIAKALIWFSGIVSVLCFCGLFCYLKFFASDFSFPIMPYLAMMVFALPLTGLYNLQLSRYRMEKNARSYFWLSVGSSVGTLIAMLLFVVVMKWGAFGKLLGPLVGNLLLFIFMLWKFKDVWKTPTTLREFRPIFIFCLPLALSAMLGYFTNGFSTTYLESVGDTAEYGIYIVGNSIGMYLTVFATAIGSTFQPDIYETTIKKQWRRYAGFCALQIGLIAAVAVVFILLAPYVLALLTAGRYVAATGYSRIIALSTVTSGIYYLINNFSIATNHPRLYLYTSILGSIFMVVCVPMAVDRWTYYGGAWMTVVSFAVFSLINLLLLLCVRAGILPRRFS